MVTARKFAKGDLRVPASLVSLASLWRVKLERLVRAGEDHGAVGNGRQAFPIYLTTEFGSQLAAARSMDAPSTVGYSGIDNKRGGEDRAACTHTPWLYQASSAL